jgi:uncharacterized protein YifN (PemK superfamily)
MSLYFLGKAKDEIKETPYKAPAISPFDFINAIHYSKDNLIVDDWSEKQYNPFIINKGLSYGADTVIPANEMNSRPHLDKKMQFAFLINSLRARKRFNKWIKADKIESIEVIKEYYGYSTEKARQVLPLLDESKLDYLRTKLIKGGRNG